MQKLKPFLNTKVLVLTILVLVVSIPILGIMTVQATAQISPDSGSQEKDLPLFLNIQGLDADTRYTVYTVQGTTETLIVNMTSSTAGKIAISVIFTETGEGRVEVRDITGVTTQASANYLVTDSFTDLLLPILIWMAIIVIGITIVIGIIARLRKSI